MRKKISILVLVLAFAIAFMPLSAAAVTPDEPEIRFINGTMYVPLRMITYGFGASAEWDRENRAALITGVNGETHKIVIEAVGGFIENGISWVPLTYVEEVLVTLLTPTMLTNEQVSRLDLTIWDEENFEEVREASFSTVLPYGTIAVNYIEYISENLEGRSAFTYRELETAVWIVEELLAMGHGWDAITVQEFTYWCIAEMEHDLFGLSWWQVTSPSILGVGRQYQLRPDRTSQNIILTIPGQSDRKIIVGAHYDSPPYPGASDNASGTALLLESAQRMLEIEHYYTIVYVFFGAEEVGLIGAFYYYESLTQVERDNILMMVNADVLIEGPHLIYGAGSMPNLDDIDIDELIDAIAEHMVREARELLIELQDDFSIPVYEVIADYETAEIEGPSYYLPLFNLDYTFEYLIEYFIAYMRYTLAPFSPYEILMSAAILGLIEPTICPVAEQVSAIAAELTSEHDFELIFIPEFIGMPSDQLVFLFEGHTVVNMTGLERRGVLDPELTAQLTRYGEGMGGFTATILHTPMDEFHFIEYMWPGMMNANMEAFVRFLEAILTGRFS